MENAMQPTRAEIKAKCLSALEEGRKTSGATVILGLIAEVERLEGFAEGIQNMRDEITEGWTESVLLFNRQPEFPSSYFVEKLDEVINEHL